MVKTEAQKKAQKKYNDKNIKRIPLDVQRSFYETELKPAADRQKETINGYIKVAIEQRIKRDATKDQP